MQLPELLLSGVFALSTLSVSEVVLYNKIITITATQTYESPDALPFSKFVLTYISLSRMTFCSLDTTRSL